MGKVTRQSVAKATSSPPQHVPVCKKTMKKKGTVKAKDLEQPRHWSRFGKYHGMQLDEKPPQDRWKKEENEKLLEAVQLFGVVGHWRQISEYLDTNKTASVCYQHYYRVLDPTICKEKFSHQEMLLLIALTKRHGSSQWTRITNIVSRATGRKRTPTQLRSRWVDINKRRNGRGDDYFSLIDDSMSTEDVIASGLPSGLWCAALSAEATVLADEQLLKAEGNRRNGGKRKRTVTKPTHDTESDDYGSENERPMKHFMLSGTADKTSIALDRLMGAALEDGNDQVKENGDNNLEETDDEEVTDNAEDDDESVTCDEQTVVAAEKEEEALPGQCPTPQLVRDVIPKEDEVFIADAWARKSSCRSLLGVDGEMFRSDVHGPRCSYDSLSLSPTYSRHGHTRYSYASLSFSMHHRSSWVYDGTAAPAQDSSFGIKCMSMSDLLNPSSGFSYKDA